MLNKSAELNMLWIPGLVLSLLLGIGYAFLLYKNHPTFSAGYRRLFFLLRTLSVALVCFLLFAPFLKFTKRTTEKPLIIFAQDNSESLKFSKPPGFSISSYSANIKKLLAQLSAKYEVKSFTFGTEVKPGSAFTFDGKATDIDAFFKMLNSRFANRNIGAVILASDGIYNRGGSPLYDALKNKAPVFTIALGDTIPKKDVMVANINHNDIVYSDNNFEVKVSISAYRCRGISSKLVISGQNGNVVFEKVVNIDGDEYNKDISAILKAGTKGFYHYHVALTPIKGELSEVNNHGDFFVEVLEGKQKVLILAGAPHPDISAIKQSIESAKSFEVKTSLTGNPDAKELKDADLLILYQLPSATIQGETLRRQIAGKPVLFVLGAQSNVPAFSQMQNVLAINGAGDIQEVIPRLNNTFSSFVPDKAAGPGLPVLGPLLSPFGNYVIKSQASVLLYQQIGAVLTARPLLLFSESSDARVGVLAGEGIWHWRLNDFRENGNHNLVDGLLSKTVRYLVSSNDKRKFRVYPASNTFDEGEHVIMNGELYNDAYELVNGPEVHLDVRDRNNRSYSFLFSRTENAYTIDAGTLPYGEYSFSAKTALGSRKYVAAGRFLISRQEPEMRQTIADHRLLYLLAQQSGGMMLGPDKSGELLQAINKSELVKTVVYEDRKYEEMINQKWIFFIILLLLTTEWFLRKREGEL